MKTFWIVYRYRLHSDLTPYYNRTIIETANDYQGLIMNVIQKLPNNTLRYPEFDVKVYTTSDKSYDAYQNAKKLKWKEGNTYA